MALIESINLFKLREYFIGFFVYITIIQLGVLCYISPCYAGNTKVNFRTIINKSIKSVVQIKTYDKTGKQISSGSGYFINNAGEVLTNMHVLEGSYGATVTIYNGKTFPVDKILAEYIEGDLITISVDIPGRLVLPLKASKSTVSAGDKIIVIGSPLGLDQTVSDGIVSALRNIPHFGDTIQLTAPISPGSSGSPVINEVGDVIGVATFQLIKGQNLNFAIPISNIGKMKKVSSNSLAEWSKNRASGITKNRDSDYGNKSGDGFDSGFRELRWGTPLEYAFKLYPDLVLSGGKGNIGKIPYRRTFENLSNFGIKFDGIVYYFKDGLFSDIFLSILEKDGNMVRYTDLSSKAYEILTQRYGKPNNVAKSEGVGETTKGETITSVWNINGITIKLYCASIKKIDLQTIILSATKSDDAEN